MVDESSTAPSSQFKGLSAGGRRIIHRGPRPFNGFPRAVDESSAANQTNLNSIENEQAKGRQSNSVFFVCFLEAAHISYIFYFIRYLVPALNHSVGEEVVPHLQSGRLWSQIQGVVSTPEPVLLNVDGAPKLIPRNEFR
jgi:hypothetical protein